jgi:diacylglycerol kinase family enzyme
LSTKKHIEFIINPNSGVRKKEALIDQLKSDLDPNTDYGLSFTERPAHATELAEEAVKNGADAVIAVGGDGSVNEVGKALINKDVALGIIPSGSGNGFARHLGIPMDSN